MFGLRERSASTPAMFTALGNDTVDRAETEIRVRGKLPPGLNGVLFRNGPGLFHRDGQTKRTVLDGDGVIQRLEFSDGIVRYSRRFVKTPKLIAEEAAARFLTPSWTTTVAKPFANIGQPIQSQAGVTTYDVNGKLLALDEGGSPGFELDRKSLETLRPAALGLPENDASPKAHAKQIAETGDWLFASTRHRRGKMLIDLVRHRRDGSRVATPTVLSPRVSFVHDFAATSRYAIFNLQAVRLHGLRFMAGLASYSECLEWAPQQGNMILLIELATGTHQTFEAPAAWAWHMANAYQHGNDIVMDFVGYDDPGHFIGPNAQLAAIMRGEEGVHGAPGTIRRYVMTPDGKLTETLLAEGNFEFPCIDWRATGALHDRVYVTAGTSGGMLHTGIAALHTRTGKLDAYDFGPLVNTGEPVFAANFFDAGDEEGWLITQILDVAKNTSAFVVLEAGNVAAGPVAVIELAETLPISFHGHWVPA